MNNKQLRNYVKNLVNLLFFSAFSPKKTMQKQLLGFFTPHKLRGSAKQYSEVLVGLIHGSRLSYQFNRIFQLPAVRMNYRINLIRTFLHWFKWRARKKIIRNDHHENMTTIICVWNFKFAYLILGHSPKFNDNVSIEACWHCEELVLWSITPHLAYISVEVQS